MAAPFRWDTLQLALAHQILKVFGFATPDWVQDRCLSTALKALTIRLQQQTLCCGHTYHTLLIFEHGMPFQALSLYRCFLIPGMPICLCSSCQTPIQFSGLVKSEGSWAPVPETKIR